MDSGYKTELGEGVYQVRTCAWSPPGDHPVGCGLKMTVQDGKIVKIEGDETHPITNGRLCPRCLAFDEVMYHPDRILHPMIRAKEDRGKDKWTRITWDEALDIIEEKVNWIKETWGAESIMVHQGTGREAALYAPAFAPASVGSPNETFTMSGSSCYGPRCCVADFILGAGYPEIDYAQFFEQRYDDPRYELPKYIVLWGKDPLYSSPDGFFGHSLIDMMKRGSKLIVIDPRITWCATRAEYHLQLRPGTDAALGMALLNVVIEEDLYDHDFVEKWCYGFKEFSERVSEWTPERAEEITWVPADTIRGAARAFATNAPSTIAWGLAIDTSWNGPQAGHCVLALAAICNYIDVPGGLVLAKPASFMGKWRFDCAKMLSDELLSKRIREPQFKGYTYPDSQPDSVFNVYGSGDPYPIKMTWIFSTNMLANTTAAEPKEWYERIKNVEFCVGQDIFMTPTIMALCDIVLPLSTFAEHDGVVLPHFGRNAHFLAAMN